MIEQDASADEAAALMRERAVRRLLVCDADHQLVGIVTLGDLATEMEMASAVALSDISEAPPNS